MNDSLAGAIDQKIREVVLPLEAAGVVIINPNAIADAVANIIDPERSAPDLAAYCAMMDLRQRCRKFLARRHDPVAKARAYTERDSVDLFGGILQDYYPSKHADPNEAVYVRRDEMSKRDLLSVAKRLRKAGSSLVEHADALEAYTASMSVAA